MQVTKNITLDLLETGSPVIIKAKQNDRNTRYIAAHLYVDGLAYPVPSGTEIAFRYKKPDGTAGFYDALPDNSPAITVSGNTVTVELVEQVLTVSGCVHCEINMYNAASEKLTTFTFEISVEESVLTDAEITSSDYYNVLTAEIAKALQAVTDATEQAENAAQSAQDAADSAAMSKDWAAGQPVTYSGTPVSIAYAGAQRIASITAYGENAQGGTTEAPVALTGVDSVHVCGRNLLPLPYSQVSETKNGLNIAVNADGTITVSGTATAETYLNLKPIPASLYRLMGVTGIVPAYDYPVTKNGFTFFDLTIQPHVEFALVYIVITKGSVVNRTYRPYIIKSAEPLPYEPYQGSVTPLPIPRALHEVGDVRDVCRTRVKSVWDKSVQVDITQLKKNSASPYQYYINVESNSVNIAVKPAASTLSYNLTTGIQPFKSGINFWMNGLLEVDDLEHAKAWFTEHPTKVFYQSTAYDGTNGLDVCLAEYQTGFAELDGKNVQAAYNPNNGRPYGIFNSYNIIKTSDGVVCSQAKTEHGNLNWGYVYASNMPITDIIFGLIGSDITSRTELNAYLAAQKEAGTPVQIAYQLATPEVYATDPLDIDNAAGPLTVLTGGEVEVRMTELIGSRSPELTGKMDKAVYAQVGNPSELDNDNFLHCVNQRNVSGTISAAGYFIDRWKLISGTVQITENGLVLNGKISQILENAAGTDVTASASAGAASYDNSTKTFTLTATGQTITWAKLEKGSVATPYVPKGYGAELVECYRYFWISSMPVNIFKTTAGDYFRNTVYFPIAMRTVPSVTILSSNGTVSVNAVTIDAVKFAGNGGNDTVTSFSASADL